MKALREIFEEIHAEKPAKKNWLDYKKDLELYYDYYFLANEFDEDYFIFKDILKDKDKDTDFRYFLACKCHRIKQIFEIKKILGQSENKHFLKALEEINIEELEKFLLNTEINYIYKKVKSRTLKESLTRDFRYILKNKFELDNLRTFLKLIK